MTEAQADKLISVLWAIVASQWFMIGAMFAGK